MSRKHTAIQRFEERCISSEIRGNAEQLGKARLILWIAVLGGPSMIGILGLAWFSLPESRVATAAIGVGHALVCSSAFFLKWSKNVSLAGAVFIGFALVQVLVATYFTGGVISPVVYAYPVMVVFASTLVAFRLGLWVALVLLFGGTLVWLPSYESYRQFTDHAPLHIRVLTLAWCMATSVAVAWLYKVESQRAQAQLLVLNEDKDRFLAYLSHELRNPLTAILGATDLLALRGQDPQNERLFGSLQRSAEGMAQVLEDALDISKSDAGVLFLELEPTEVLPLVEGIITECMPLAETKEITLRLLTTKGARFRVMADRRRLEQVLRNLLSNGLKFTEPDGRVQLEVTEDSSGFLMFVVADSGVGIEDSDLETILKPYGQVGSSTKIGAGLGLPICCRLLERMESQLQVESEFGVGSRFGFSLPIVARSVDRFAVENRVEGGVAVAKAERLAGLQVLVVDDTQAAREVICDLLLELGCLVEVAIDGVEALEKVSHSSPHLLLLDIQMPRLDGVETATRLRRRFDQGDLGVFPVVAVTGNLDAHNRLAETGLFDSVLAKPVGLSDLRDCLCQVVGA